MRLLLLPVLTFLLLVHSISGTDSLGRNDFIIRVPFALVLLASSVPQSQEASNVWIPTETPKEVDASVQNEYAEVSTVFAKPEAKVVQTEVLPSDQAVPWTSLKQEYELYKKFHANKQKKKKESSEDSDEEEEDQDQEDLPEELPQAFHGQENADDDERDWLQKEKEVRTKVKRNRKKKEEDSEEDEEEDDLDAPASELQALDQLTNEEKQEMINRIFAESGYPQSEPVPSFFSPQGESEEDALDDEDEDEEEDDEPSAVTKKVTSTKGDAGDLQDDKGGKKKKKKKKKKKGKKKGGHGWGWKKPIVIPIPPPKEDKGWGWGHDGVLEQMVKGSTWERVLAYYHGKRDEWGKNKGGGGWGDQKIDWQASAHATGEGLVNKLFKGSFWERAFQTYSQYKKNNVGAKGGTEFGDWKEPPVKIDW